MDSFKEIWELVQQELQNNVTEVAYKVWLQPLEFVSFKNDTIYLSINEFKKGIVIDKFLGIIHSTLESIFGFRVNVDFVVPEEQKKNAPGENDKTVSGDDEYDYTFNNFITGPSNKFAYAAAMNVASNPGKTYNPLFIYGHSGLGKTHLLMAIMDEIKNQCQKYKGR